MNAAYNEMKKISDSFDCVVFHDVDMLPQEILKSLGLQRMSG